MPASRLLEKGAELMTLRGMMYGAICGACYGLLVVPIAVFVSMPTQGQLDQGVLSASLVLTMFIALVGTILGAIYGAFLGAFSGVLAGLVLGAVTHADFVTLRNPSRYRLVMRAFAVGCAALLLAPLFAFIPLVPFQDPHSLWGWLIKTAGPTLAACAAAWFAGGQFAGWYIGEWIQADYIRSMMAAYPYPPPYPYPLPYPPPYAVPFAYYPIPYPPAYPPTYPAPATPTPTPPDASPGSPPPVS